MVSPCRMRGKGISSLIGAVVPAVLAQGPLDRLRFKTARHAEIDAAPIRYVAQGPTPIPSGQSGGCMRSWSRAAIRSPSP
jgi:hypothetical protein